jgi:hypothetical protein
MGPLKAIKVSPWQAATKLPHNYMPNKTFGVDNAIKTTFSLI